ncbi:MAG: retron system putative HNH endonuclease [Planktothrix sp. GU0601_MAG3]|nr:MAG: retron system putative HNH endonuclease [Planktothrix sp. GU0601_MAG3]
MGVNCDYQSFPNPQKRLVRLALLREQGYICCYCCQKIERENSHIEHFLPQSKTDAELSVTYSNLLASCGSDQHWPKHCGNQRKNNPLPVSPLETNCEDYFRYTVEGEIIPTNNLELKDAAKQTIDILNLNNYDLKRMRSEAIQALGIGEELTKEEAQKLANFYSQLDEQERYQPFCVAILYSLKAYFGIEL